MRAKLKKEGSQMKNIIFMQNKPNPLIAVYLFLTGVIVPLAMAAQLEAAMHTQVALIGSMFIMASLAMLKLSGGMKSAVNVIRANKIPFIVSLVMLAAIYIGLSRWTLVLLQPVL